jgi:small-conductance mechanosensitive channel
MNIQQEINLQIYEEFIKRGIGFAYPTQNVFFAAKNTQQKENFTPPVEGLGYAVNEQRRPASLK